MTQLYDNNDITDTSTMSRLSWMGTETTLVKYQSIKNNKL